jgi:hypothetical protein
MNDNLRQRAARIAATMIPAQRAEQRRDYLAELDAVRWVHDHATHAELEAIVDANLPGLIATADVPAYRLLTTIRPTQSAPVRVVHEFADAVMSPEVRESAINDADYWARFAATAARIYAGLREAVLEAARVAPNA